MFCFKILDLTSDISKPNPYNLNRNNILLLYRFYDVIQIKIKTNILYPKPIRTYKFTRMRPRM